MSTFNVSETQMRTHSHLLVQVRARRVIGARTVHFSQETPRPTLCAGAQFSRKPHDI